MDCTRAPDALRNVHVLLSNGIYRRVGKKMSHMCAHIYVHAYMIRFVISPVLSEYIYERYACEQQYSRLRAYRILHSNCVPIKEIASMHFLAYVFQTIYKNAFYK